ncbi:MAG: hypothetical protein D6767_04365, partial [Candidatus Hydrogenedentota bacterium]
MANKQKFGFTFFEVLVTLLLVSLLVYTVQITVVRLMKVEAISSEEKSMVQFLSGFTEKIKTPKGFTQYLLNSSEQKQYKNSPKSNYFLTYKFVKGQKSIVFNQWIRFRGEYFHIKILREVIESIPFLFGVEIHVRKKGSKDTRKIK